MWGYNYGSGRGDLSRAGWPIPSSNSVRMEVLAEDHGFECGGAIAAERKLAR